MILFLDLDFEVATRPIQLDLSTTPIVRRACVTYGVANDVVVDPNEIFDVILETSTMFASVRALSSSATVTIIDDDEG